MKVRFLRRRREAPAQHAPHRLGLHEGGFHLVRGDDHVPLLLVEEALFFVLCVSRATRVREVVVAAEPEQPLRAGGLITQLFPDLLLLNAEETYEGNLTILVKLNKTKLFARVIIKR